MSLPMLFAAAAAMAIAPLPAASEWYRVAMGPDAAWYVDLTSIKTNGQWTAASEYSIYKVQSEKTGVKYVRLSTEYDCGARKMRYLRLIAYDANGGLKADQPMPGGDKIFDLTPGTVISGVADYICGVNRGRGTRVADPLTDRVPQ